MEMPPPDTSESSAPSPPSGLAPPQPFPSRDGSNLDWLNLILQLHIAEYSALMNRGTNSLTLESGMWVLIVVFASLLPTIWKIVPHDLVVWGGFGVLLVMLFVWLNILNEHYHSIRYIEHDLRKRIADLLAVAHDRFWQYEPYIGHQRPQSQPFWYESAPAVVASALFIWVAWYRYWLPDRQSRECYEFAIDLALLCAFIWANARMMGVRRRLPE